MATLRHLAVKVVYCCLKNMSTIISYSLSILGIIAFIAFIQYDKEVPFKRQCLRVAKIFLIQYVVVLLLVGCFCGLVLLFGDAEGAQATAIARIKSGVMVKPLLWAPFYAVETFVSIPILLPVFLGFIVVAYFVRRLYRRWYPLKLKQKVLLYMVFPLYSIIAPIVCWGIWCVYYLVSQSFV